MDVGRENALTLDANDPLARFRDESVIDDSDLIYLGGNSLGRLTKASVGAVRDALERG